MVENFPLIDHSLQLKLGFTARYPKWATAYKFKAELAYTKLKDIVFTVGRTGQVTPNAILEPVILMGSLISKTTLHNEDYVIERNIKIGDTVAIKKAGDVIPEVVEPLIERRNGTEIDFIMTKTCPICGTELVRKESEAAYYCTNLNCDAKHIEGLIHFASRTAMNITGFGERVVEDMYNLGFIKTIPDFYKLENYKKEIMLLEGYGEKSVDNLLTELEESKKNSLEKLLFALGIRHVGLKTATIIARKFLTMDNIIESSYEDLNDISDVGSIIAKSVNDYLQDENNLKMIDDLKELGLNMDYLGKVIDNPKIKDKAFVITGTLNIKRDDLKDKIISSGGKVIESVSRKTDYLVLGRDPGSKYDKAKNLNIPILNEDEILELLGE